MRISDNAGIVTIALEGRADVSCTRSLWEELRPMLDRSLKEIVVDVYAVTKLDAAMLQLLVVLGRATQAKSLQLRWRGVTPLVIEPAQVLGMVDELGLAHAESDRRSAHS